MDSQHTSVRPSSDLFPGSAMWIAAILATLAGFGFHAFALVQALAKNTPSDTARLVDKAFMVGIDLTNNAAAIFFAVALILVITKSRAAHWMFFAILVVSLEGFTRLFTYELSAWPSVMRAFGPAPHATLCAIIATLLLELSLRKDAKD